MNSDDRTRLLLDALAERILVIGGPYGTYVHGRNLSAADFGGPEHEGCPEQLNVSRPDVVSDTHRGYLEAGADIITTNTFGRGSIVLAEFGPTGAPISNIDPVEGPTTTGTSFLVGLPELAGRYTFHCPVHPQMTGSFTVEGG